MAHHKPKIVYGALDTAIVFANPEIGLGEREQGDSIEHSLKSLSGLRQVNVDYLEKKKKIKFGYLSEAEVDTLETFFQSWAYLGKQFKYYKDQDSASYVTYELDDLKFKPKRTSPAGANVFYYEIPFVFTRVENEDLVDYTEATILNNQAAAVNLTGVTLSSASYKSVRIFHEIRRKTDTQELVENGVLVALFKDSTGTWDITPEGTSEGDDAGVTFSVSGSQIQYTSTNVTGGNYVGTMKIKNVTF